MSFPGILEKSVHKIMERQVTKADIAFGGIRRDPESEAAPSGVCAGDISPACELPAVGGPQRADLRPGALFDECVSHLPALEERRGDDAPFRPCPAVPSATGVPPPVAPARACCPQPAGSPAAPAVRGKGGVGAVGGLRGLVGTAPPTRASAQSRPRPQTGARPGPAPGCANVAHLFGAAPHSRTRRWPGCGGRRFWNAVPAVHRPFPAIGAVPIRVRMIPSAGDRHCTCPLCRNTAFVKLVLC